ncbi:carbohydrate-binding protein [Flammeovirga aprica]|uniref:Carbohydrate-binding protein n=1 Tax=Flammeovirga aprica JL-4 TaxID=694437 RepID=A0A7X9RTX5_9BACT|nr:carbohydrate-binding protein [Flammeovirga aprica]NME68209.1 carbohydrate-binding protein [Flammeovirga aprica JL-4]
MNNNKKSIRFSLAIMPLLLLLTNSVFSQTVVNSLSALKPYLDDNNANVKLAPGTYTIDASDIASGAWGYDVPYFDSYTKTVMHFAGNNSTYDFTGVTINFDTDLFTSAGSKQIWELQITGSDNVLKGLTMVDDGTVDDAPSKGVCNIVMDGENNRIQDFHVTIKGSYPYGYGDAFGKGGTNNIIAHRKHSACLVRGESNHVLNSTFIHRSYGHCIFMQAASNPKIEGCYVEGEVRTTDDMLAEEGTGSPADNVDFMTTWGYKLPAGYMMSLGEEGIRAYNAGETVINGVFIERGTSSPTVLNCNVKRMRGGVTLPHATGTVTVAGCTVRECEGGYQLAGGTLTNSSSDCVYGPVYKSAYDNDDPSTLDITILPAEVPYYNGSKSVAYLGNDHGNITLTGSEAIVDQNLKITLGGYFDGVGLKNGNASSQNDHTGYYLNLTNNTFYPVEIPSGANYNSVISCGTVTNNGSNNTISSSTNCPSSSCSFLSAFSRIEAENYCDQSGVDTEPCDEGGLNVGWIDDNDWIKFDDVDFGNGANSVDLRVSSRYTGGTVQLRLGSTSGTLIGTASVPATGQWQNWTTVTTPISNVSGTQDLYLVFTNGGININWLEFSASCASFSGIQAEDFNGMSGIVDEGNNVGFVHNNDWARYENIDLTCAQSIAVRASSQTNGGSIEVRLGSALGTLIGTVNIGSTGNWNSWQTNTASISSTNGTHDVYLVFKGGSGYLFNLDWLEFSTSSSSSREGNLLLMENNLSPEIRIYPNPVTDILNIKNAEGADVKIYNTSGSLIYKKQNSGSVINISNLEDGILIIHVTDNSVTKVFKVIKQ